VQTEYHEPINLGQDRMITVNELVDIIANIAGKKITKHYDLTKPQGVRGRNSDNTKLREVLKWEPQVSLEEGLERTYKWIYEQLVITGRITFQEDKAYSLERFHYENRSSTSKTS